VKRSRTTIRLVAIIVALAGCSSGVKTVTISDSSNVPAAATTTDAEVSTSPVASAEPRPAPPPLRIEPYTCQASAADEVRCRRSAPSLKLECQDDTGEGHEYHCFRDTATFTCAYAHSAWSCSGKRTSAQESLYDCPAGVTYVWECEPV
jgi:hypothetical protein